MPRKGHFTIQNFNFCKSSTNIKIEIPQRVIFSFSNDTTELKMLKNRFIWNMYQCRGGLLTPLHLHTSPVIVEIQFFTPPIPGKRRSFAHLFRLAWSRAIQTLHYLPLKQLPQGGRCSSVDSSASAFHAAALGSNPKHNIYAISI